MSKNIVGIDIGYDNLKLVWMKNGRVVKYCVESMPEKLIKEGRATTIEGLSEVLRNALKKNGIHAGDAAVVLNEEVSFVRNVEVPKMTEEQLATNLPYEFHDYITEELKKYYFDYAVREIRENEMDLFAVAAPIDVVDNIRLLVRKAGMKLSVLAPTVSAYENLLSTMPGFDPEAENCIMDLGYHNIRVHIFKGARHQTTRIMETGLSAVDQVVADSKGVDVHLAHTYLVSNYENCQEDPDVQAAFQGISLELMRMIHFYQFSNQSSNLNGVYVVGGGSEMQTLKRILAENIDVAIYSDQELIANRTDGEHAGILAAAIGIALH